MKLSDINNLVDYESLAELDLIRPGTDELLGVKFWVRSIDSSAAERVLFQHSDKVAERYIKRREFAKTEQNKRAEIERTAACVARWNLDDTLTLSAAVDLFEKQPWIERRVREVAEKEANFITTSPPDSAG